LLWLARKVAIKIIEKDPDLMQPEWKTLQEWVQGAAHLYEEGRLN
jgi:hypothetical protein